MDEMNEIEVKVGALILDPHSGTPIVILKGLNEETVLPIWVGTFEANAIALEIEKGTPQRPLTHDLMRNVIVEMGGHLERVIISDLRENTFYALIEMSIDGEQRAVMDARPSDAIALALRFDCSIWVSRKVLDVAGSDEKKNSTTDDEETIIEESNEEWPDIIGESGNLPM